MKLLQFVFPTKPHVEDLDPTFAFISRAIFVCGVICFLWSTYFLAQWGRSLAFQPIVGRVEYGALRFVQDHVTNVSFDYAVAGKHYTSQNIAIGGRPMGTMPEEGPVTVYYNPHDPGEAVLFRRPTEAVVLAFFFALLSPFLARVIWRTYA